MDQSLPELSGGFPSPAVHETRKIERNANLLEILLRALFQEPSSIFPSKIIARRQMSKGNDKTAGRERSLRDWKTLDNIKWKILPKRPVIAYFLAEPPTSLYFLYFSTCCQPNKRWKICFLKIILAHFRYPDSVQFNKESLHIRNLLSVRYSDTEIS